MLLFRPHSAPQLPHASRRSAAPRRPLPAGTREPAVPSRGAGIGGLPLGGEAQAGSGPAVAVARRRCPRGVRQRRRSGGAGRHAGPRRNARTHTGWRAPHDSRPGSLPPPGSARPAGGQLPGRVPRPGDQRRRRRARPPAPASQTPTRRRALALRTRCAAQPRGRPRAAPPTAGGKPRPAPQRAQELREAPPLRGLGTKPGRDFRQITTDQRQHSFS